MRLKKMYAVILVVVLADGVIVAAWNIFDGSCFIIGVHLCSYYKVLNYMSESPPDDPNEALNQFYHLSWLCSRMIPNGKRDECFGWVESRFGPSDAITSCLKFSVEPQVHSWLCVELQIEALMADAAKVDRDLLLQRGLARCEKEDEALANHCYFYLATKLDGERAIQACNRITDERENWHYTKPNCLRTITGPN